MNTPNPSKVTTSPFPTKSPTIEPDSRGTLGRRSFLKGLGATGAACLPAAALLTVPPSARAGGFGRGLTQGDVDILRFVTAAEIIETDLWLQYKELADHNAPFAAALSNLDADMVQYVDDNTDDEDSHQKFLNAFLVSVGAAPVNLDRFRTLNGSHATGADMNRRWLTNLMHLNVDTSWYTRYRSTENPDFGAAFPQAVVIQDKPAIPATDADLGPTNHLQAIANTAAFHFPTIEQGGSSLYASLIPKATRQVVLRILAAIGGSEVNHFAVWHDKAGNAVADPLAPLTDPVNGLTFPNLNAKSPRNLFQTNLIFPEPCDFIVEEGLPPCSIIRPTTTSQGGAVAAARFLSAMNLFLGQSKEFFDQLFELAAAADRARRQLDAAGYGDD
ncbi:MAG TPA: ferritin-like domain-containing protein [Chthoniobacterales bacterium]